MAEWLAAVKEKRYAAVKGKSGPEPRPVHLSTFLVWVSVPYKKPIKD